MSQLIDEFHNADVTWDGTFVGLSPSLVPELEARVATLRPQDAAPLLAALADPDRFVLAHVLLTQLSGVTYESSPTWNGLAVDLLADGETRIDAAQRGTLQRRWERYYSLSPRPERLPDA